MKILEFPRAKLPETMPGEELVTDVLVACNVESEDLSVEILKGYVKELETFFLRNKDRW